MTDDQRGSGRTKAQLRALPIGGVFIVQSNDAVVYTNGIANYINRSDIQVVPISWIDHYRWQGMKMSGIDLDHHCSLTERQMDIYCLIKSRHVREI